MGARAKDRFTIRVVYVCVGGGGGGEVHPHVPTHIPHDTTVIFKAGVFQHYSPGTHPVSIGVVVGFD